MRQHYDAAYRLQSSGDIEGADREHKMFLADAVHQAANGLANIGEYDRAASLYDEALRLGPQDFALYIDYAGAAFDAKDPARAKALAQDALGLHSRTTNTQNATAHMLLAQADWGLGDHRSAVEEYKAAAAMDPVFKNIYALATAYLSLGELQNASRIFAEMLGKFGDTAVMHMEIGRAYATSGHFDEAIPEFRQAMAKDPELPGVHYSLGASYMSRDGEAAFPLAESEFRKELAIQPNDRFSYPQLGRIALGRHEYNEAEKDLLRSIELDPVDPETFLKLSQLYTETNRPSDAEGALRKAIAATMDPSRDRYSIHTAHYQLGRLLIEDGNVSEGRKEIEIAAELLRLNRLQDETTLTGKPIVHVALKITRVATPVEKEEEKAFEDRVGPLIAASYNNLGVHAATLRDYASASGYFEHAAQWNPALDGVDSNWGHAAFAAHRYAEAVGPLRHSFQAHPEDNGLRSTLGVCLYMLHEYGEARQIFRPLEPSVSDVPFLSAVVADLMVKTGDPADGMDRLRSLERTSPGDALVHRALGEGYASAGDNQRAEHELRFALRLNSLDSDAQYSLALTLIALGQTEESETMLSALSNAGARDSRFYWQLAQLRLNRGETKDAIRVLEAGAEVNPDSGAIHLALAQAYHRNAQLPEAQREAKLSQALLAWHPPANRLGKADGGR